MMKNKKGFTLVELIVAIALVISITVIAIISINSISKKNKEQAYELVKEQIENAAEEYFNNNEYLFEGLKDSAVGYISVGRLVEENMINTVTDPRTGKKIAECSLVKVTKEDGKFNINFDDVIDNDNCDNNKYIVAVNSDSEKYVIPTISVNPRGTLGENDWYKSLSEVKITVTVDEKLSVSSVKRVHNEVTTTIDFTNFEYDDASYYSNDGKYEKVQYIVTDSIGNHIDTKLTIKKDGTKPTGEFNINSNKVSYNSNNVELKIYASDNVSGVYNIKYDNASYDINKFKTPNFLSDGLNYTYQKKLTISNINIANSLDGKVYTEKVYVYDEAGNYTELSENYTVYDECANNNIKPNTTTSRSNCQGACGNGKQTVTETTSYKDKKTGIECKKATKKTYEVACDNVPHNITINFDINATNNAKSTNKNKGDIFPNKTGIYKYGLVKNNNLGCSNCSTANNSYIGQACENVSDYKRYFTIGDEQVYLVGNNTYTGVGCPSGKTCIYTNNNGIGKVIAWRENARYDCFNSANTNAFNPKNCGNSTGNQPDFTEWHFKFVPDCGDVSSNEIILYTKYSVDCDY